MIPITLHDEVGASNTPAIGGCALLARNAPELIL